MRQHWIVVMRRLTFLTKMTETNGQSTPERTLSTKIAQTSGAQWLPKGPSKSHGQGTASSTASEQATTQESAF
jgi:hypothetical protein